MAKKKKKAAVVEELEKEIAPETTAEVENEAQEEAIEIEITEPAKGNEGVEALQKQLIESKDQYLRLMAEFDNYRKRTRREMDAQREYAAESVLKALLPVLDDFSRSMTAMEKTDNLTSLKEGVNMVHDKLHRVLEKEGLKSLESLGKPFDLEVHEAIASVPAPEDAKKGVVLDVVETGYRLKDKVIRYAKVVVGE